MKAINTRRVEGVTYAHPLTFDDFLAFATIPPIEIARILELAREANERCRLWQWADADNRLYRDLPDPFAPYIHFDGLYDMGVTIHTWWGNNVYLGIPPLWLDGSLAGER